MSESFQDDQIKWSDNNFEKTIGCSFAVFASRELSSAASETCFSDLAHGCLQARTFKEQRSWKCLCAFPPFSQFQIALAVKRVVIGILSSVFFWKLLTMHDWRQLWSNWKRIFWEEKCDTNTTSMVLASMAITARAQWKHQCAVWVLSVKLYCYTEAVLRMYRVRTDIQTCSPVQNLLVKTSTVHAAFERKWQSNNATLQRKKKPKQTSRPSWKRKRKLAGTTLNLP